MLQDRTYFNFVTVEVNQSGDKYDLICKSPSSMNMQVSGKTREEIKNLLVTWIKTVFENDRRDDV